MKPCPQSCAAVISAFDVDGIPDARGVRRIATAEDIEAAGTEDEDPSESYWVGFTAGSIVYTLDLGDSRDPYPRSKPMGRELVLRAAYRRLAGRNAVSPPSVEAHDRFLDLLIATVCEAAIDPDAPEPGFLQHSKRTEVV